MTVCIEIYTLQLHIMLQYTYQPQSTFFVKTKFQLRFDTD